MATVQPIDIGLATVLVSAFPNHKGHSVQVFVLTEVVLQWRHVNCPKTPTI